MKSPFIDKNGTVICNNDVVCYEGKLMLVVYAPMLRQWGLKDNEDKNSFSFTSLRAVNCNDLEVIVGEN